MATDCLDSNFGPATLKCASPAVKTTVAPDLGGDPIESNDALDPVRCPMDPAAARP